MQNCEQGYGDYRNQNPDELYHSILYATPDSEVHRPTAALHYWHLMRQPPVIGGIFAALKK